MAKAWGEGISGRLCSTGCEGSTIQVVWKTSGNTKMSPKTQVPLDSSVMEQYGQLVFQLTVPRDHGEATVLGCPRVHSILAYWEAPTATRAHSSLKHEELSLKVLPIYLTSGEHKVMEDEA